MQARHATGRPQRRLHPQRQRRVWLSWRAHRQWRIPPVSKFRAVGVDGHFPNTPTAHGRQARDPGRYRRIPYHLILRRNWRATRCSDRHPTNRKMRRIDFVCLLPFLRLRQWTPLTPSSLPSIATISDSVYSVTFASDPIRSMRYFDMLFARSGPRIR